MNTLRLSDILAHGVPIEWFEAVALVRDVADEVLATGGTPRVPELNDILVLQEGRVSITDGVTVDDPVRRLGQLLQATLVTSEPPVQLRLLVSQAMSPVPTIGSVTAFQDALGYFERPNRSGLLRAVYDRGLQHASQRQDRPAPTLDMIAPLPQSAGTPTPKPPVVTRRRAWIPAAAVLVAALVVAAYGPTRSLHRASQAGVFASHAADRLGAVVLAGVSAVSEAAGLGRLVTGESAAAPSNTAPSPAAGGTATASTNGNNRHSPAATANAAPTTGSTKSSAGRASKRDPAKAPSNVAAVELYDLESAPARNSAPAVSTPAASDPPPAGPVWTPEPRVADNAVYSASDEVTPPVLLRQHLPKELPSDVRKADLVRIEFIVLPNGTVDEVKLHNHRDVKDAMFLSAVKAWEFEPARKNDVPVKFRKVVWAVFHP